MLIRGDCERCVEFGRVAPNICRREAVVLLLVENTVLLVAIELLLSGITVVIRETTVVVIGNRNTTCEVDAGLILLITALCIVGSLFIVSKNKLMGDC